MVNLVNLDTYTYVKDECGNLHRKVSFTEHGELLNFYSETIYLSSKFWFEEILRKTQFELEPLVEYQTKKAIEIKNLIDENINDFSEGGSLLEIGCGVGSFLYQLKDTNLSLTGIDISKYSTQVSNILYGRQRYKIYQCEALEQMQSTMNVESWDYIAVFDFLEHIKNDDLFLSTLKPQLKPNGKLIIEVPIFHTENVETLKSETYLYPEHHLHLYCENGLDTLFQSFGFTVIYKELFRSNKKIIFILGA